MAPNPHHSQSFAGSPPPLPPPQVNGLPPQPGYHPAPNVPYAMSFDTATPQPAAPMYNQSFNGPVSNPGYARSFGPNSFVRGFDKPQIYTAVYSGVSVYEMEIGGVACMRRRSDGWLNATQILKVAGVEKGKRTKVLEKEILTGEHEKVQGGYGKYQGTWISYRRGREFCRQYGVEDILRPLLDYDISADGTGGQGQGQDTPTKEQAMAANRKRFYSNQSIDAGRPNGNGPVSGGTFFQNISPSTSVALAAMNKAARLNSPAPRSSSAQRPPNVRNSSQQDSLPQGSQQSMASNDSFRDDSGYGTQPAVNGEPPRKRIRAEDSSASNMAPPAIPMDTSMRSASPTEPNESFYYDGVVEASQQEPNINGNGEPVAAPPLPAPTSEEQQEKMNLILDLFADSSRTDFAHHPALTQLSGEDLNMPLDTSANNALHWAATLAKVPLLKLLIHRGANIWRGNSAGYTPLISAVIVNNCWEYNCFPDVLDLLGPLLEVRDLRAQTILHHIATNSGVKGRAPSSKYYLEALLEFLVRTGTQPNSAAAHNAQSAASKVAAVASEMANNEHVANESGSNVDSQDTTAFQQGGREPVNLVRFLSHIVNARDKAGNTALNLVARIGNRSIIQQLLEIHADPNLPNNKGLSAKDFGVGIDSSLSQSMLVNGTGLLGQQTPSQQASQVTQTQPDGDLVDGNDAVSASPKIEDLGKEVVDAMTAMLSENLAAHKETLKARAEQIDRLNEQIRELSAVQQQDMKRLQELQTRVKSREEKRGKIARLRQFIIENRGKESQLPLGRADKEFDPNLSSMSTLRAQLAAYRLNNAALQRKKDDLRSRSAEQERMYRKVVALCTNVPEERVEASLEALVAAVESERGGIGEAEVGRVREFLRKVDGSHSRGLSGITEAPMFGELRDGAPILGA